MDPIVSIKNVSLQIGGNNILTDVSFSVEKGEKIFIMGGDGSGKSVLLKLLVGLFKYQSGEVKVFGENLESISRKGLREVRKKIGFVFQEGALAASLTAIENLMLPLSYHSIYKKELVRNVAKELLAMVGMQDYADHYPVELNIGMKKKVGIARALTMNPGLILYDDPSLNLAGLPRRRLEEHIIWLHDKLGKTSIIVSSNLQYAKREADKLLLIDKGKVLGFGSLEELESGPDEKIKNYLITGNMAKIF